MAKEKINLKRLYFVILLFGLWLFPCEIRGAINSGDIIVNNAIGYLGQDYVLGYPPNKEFVYGGGGIFNLDNWTGWMDCSGLVSLCAGLRRHYGTSELYQFTDYINWENLQAGDLLLGSGHTLIVEWIQQEGTNTDKWKVGVIHAPKPGEVVKRLIITVAGCKNYGWLPRRFKNDTQEPTIKFDGVEDGKCYNKPVTLSVNGNDNLEGPTYAYGIYDNKKFKQKDFDSDGNYEVKGIAIDWANNLKEDKIVFSIDTVPPTILFIGAEDGKKYCNDVSVKYKVTDVGCGIYKVIATSTCSPSSSNKIEDIFTCDKRL